MPRARASDNQRSRSKTAPIEELTHGIKKFEEVLAAVKDYSRDGFPYRDAAQSKAELQFREYLRHTFGERSEEFQKYRNVKLRAGDKDEATQSLAVIKGLIQGLEDRKLELQGLKPPAKPEPAREGKVNTPPQMVLVPPVPPTTATAQTIAPTTVAVAMTAPVAPPISPVAPVPPLRPAIPEPLVAQPTPPPPIAPTPSPTYTPAPVATEPPWFSPPSQAANIVLPVPAAQERPVEVKPAPLAPTPPPTITSSAQPIPVTPEKPVEVKPAIAPFSTPPASASPSISPFPSAQPHLSTQAPAHSAPTTHIERAQTVAPPPPISVSDKPSANLSQAHPSEPTPNHDPLQLIRKICLRFHAVVRQLRLRKDDRQTLEVTDDYDLQDLLCALLKVEFDEVATDEWTPPYTGGTPRTMLLVNKDDIAVVAKKTKAGLTPKELTDQVTADAAYFRAQGRCSTLFCFLYDPDGRIGSPKRLETTLTSAGEHFRIEVLVAPK